MWKGRGARLGCFKREMMPSGDFYYFLSYTLAYIHNIHTLAYIHNIHSLIYILLNRISIYKTEVSTCLYRYTDTWIYVIGIY